MSRDIRAELGLHRTPVRLILAHRSLLPVARLIARHGLVCGISVICHGSDVWGSRPGPRGHLERLLMRSAEVRLIAVSSFTAGALSELGRPVTVLPPGVSEKWFDALVVAAACRPTVGPRFTLVTTFRLREWKDKGLPELVVALGMLERSDVRLVVCGSGPAPTGLTQLIEDHDFCSLKAGLDDSELAAQYACADLFVLATRTRTGSRPCGEGFGLVLLEAQIAGVPVIGPAYGGARDAYIEGITGLTPSTEAPEDLARTIEKLLADPARRVRMAQRSAEWSRERFAPASYAARAVAGLL
jgi:phosphatidyl-myo-inositol dimannoside synthase